MGFPTKRTSRLDVNGPHVGPELSSIASGHLAGSLGSPGCGFRFWLCISHGILDRGVVLGSQPPPLNETCSQWISAAGELEIAHGGPTSRRTEGMLMPQHRWGALFFPSIMVHMKGLLLELIDGKSGRTGNLPFYLK